MQTLGERLKYARKKGLYTQDSLAKKIGVSRGVIFNLEKDTTQPQMVVINAICQVLNINKEWLLHGKGKMDSTDALAELYRIMKQLSREDQFFLLDIAKGLKHRQR